MAKPFGLIRDLAAIERSVRTKINTAQHFLDIARYEIEENGAKDKQAVLHLLIQVKETLNEISN